MEQPSNALKARLARLPPIPAFSEDTAQDVSDASTETESSTASVQTIVPVEESRYLHCVGILTVTSQTEPSSWTMYFENNIQVPSSKDASIVFNVYYSSPSAPNAPVYVFHHGAGSSALSFALVAAHLISSIQCGVIAFDVRYHGASTVDDVREWDLSLETLSHDEADVVKGVATKESWGSQSEGWPDLILVGHRLLPPYNPYE
jgi:protein phosphatase methylesterase 1